MKYTQNRELSWLRFNKRVLEEATDPDVPAFEKLKFISIFTSNLDEFFMIRVGSLYDQTFLPKPQIDNKTGMTAAEQLDAIFEAVSPLISMRDDVFAKVCRELEYDGIRYVGASDFTEKDEKYLHGYFESYVQPVLSPQIINNLHPFPHLINKALYIVLELKIDKANCFGIVPVPASLDRIVCLPGDGTRYTLLENVIFEYAGEIFENCDVQSKIIASVTRNADVNVGELASDEDEDFRDQMKKVLKKRMRLSPVRLLYKGEGHAIEKFLREKLKLKKAQSFKCSAPLEMSYVFPLLDRIPENLSAKVTYRPFSPQVPCWFRNGISMIEAAKQRDLLLHFPFEEMDPFLQLLREAAGDPRVISIKITIYRLASKATLVDYLRIAAENGKDVTVLMELRARFDEASNINWSEALEDAGCTVIYGIEDYKVHSKVCQITLMEEGVLTRITQIGTGNYNEKTAAMYTDLSLITSDSDIGNDAAIYFKNMSIANLQGKYKELLVAPFGMKNRILDLIELERYKAQTGLPARIRVKINSLTDKHVIDALVEAARAGVKVDMIIRGICCLIPGIPGLTENIHVTSIVGRYLEHSRIYCFGAGGSEDVQMYISSADFMTRNLNRRVEVACPVHDVQIKDTILDIMDTMFSDTRKARYIGNDGEYHCVKGDMILDSQQEFMNRALLAASDAYRPQDINNTQQPLKSSESKEDAGDAISEGVISEEKVHAPEKKKSLFARIIEYFRS